MRHKVKDKTKQACPCRPRSQRRTSEAAGSPVEGPAPSGETDASGQVLPAGVSAVSPWMRLAGYLVEGLLATITLGIGWLIWAAMTAGSGQTPAKRVLKQRVIDSGSLQPVGMGKMFWMRGLVAGVVGNIAIVFTLGIILLMPFWDKRNQNIWDKISSTYVVHDPNDAWATAA